MIIVKVFAGAGKIADWQSSAFGERGMQFFVCWWVAENYVRNLLTNRQNIFGALFVL